MRYFLCGLYRGYELYEYEFDIVRRLTIGEGVGAPIVVGRWVATSCEVGSEATSIEHVGNWEE
jgi:hypothetical protein